MCQWDAAESIKANSSRASKAGPFCVGELEDEQGRPAIVIVNRNLTRSTQFTVIPKTKTTIQRVSAYTGLTRPIGAEDDWLPPGGGLLLLLHD